MGMAFRWINVFLMVMLFSAALPGCSAGTTVQLTVQPEFNLDYNQSPKAIVMEIVNVVFWQELQSYGNRLGPCNYFPYLRIYGDGRVFYSDSLRGLLEGKINYQTILISLESQRFFDPLATDTVAPAPPFYHVNIYLYAGTFSRGDDNRVDGWIKQLEIKINPTSLTPFVPQEAVLHVEDYGNYIPGGGFPEWPAGLSFGPEDTQYSNFTVKGNDLAIVWKGLQGQQLPVKGFNYHGRDWAVWLTIPGLMNDQGDCNPAPRPTPLPTGTWFPYPAPATPLPGSTSAYPYAYPANTPAR